MAIAPTHVHRGSLRLNVRDLNTALLCDSRVGDVAWHWKDLKLAQDNQIVQTAVISNPW